MIVIVLAIGAACGWGVSDFLGGVKTRTVQLLPVLLISQATALGLLAAFMSVRGGLPTPASLGYAAVAGLAETVAVAALYRGLAVGAVSVVAAVTSTAPMVPLLAGLLWGEVPGMLQLAGITVALTGLVTTSYRSDEDSTAGQVLPSVGFGVLAAGGFGTFLLAMGTAGAGGVGWALLTARLTAVGLISAVVLCRRRRVTVLPKDLPAIAAIGILIVVAMACTRPLRLSAWSALSPYSGPCTPSSPLPWLASSRKNASISRSESVSEQRSSERSRSRQADQRARRQDRSRRNGLLMGLCDARSAYSAGDCPGSSAHLHLPADRLGDNRRTEPPGTGVPRPATSK